MLAAGVAQAEVAKEYQIKAAFLYKFTKFVEWPENRFAAADAPLVIAVLGRNPFGDELDRVVQDRSVNGHPIVIRYLPTLAEAKPLPASCHVLFVAAGGEDLLARLAVLPVPGPLTVGESPEFAAKGMVTFVVVGEKVRFEIDADRAERAGLRVSAQLQKLALIVKPKP